MQPKRDTRSKYEAGLFFAGSLVAIMGPSGCGKTTLMSIISGRASLAHSGRVAINGRPRTKEFDRVGNGSFRECHCRQHPYWLFPVHSCSLIVKHG